MLVGPGLLVPLLIAAHALPAPAPDKAPAKSNNQPSSNNQCDSHRKRGSRMMHCDNRCCDVNTDNDHCGQCGHRCTGGQKCDDGRCQCERGMQPCRDGTCKGSCQPQGCSSGYVSCPGGCTKSTTVGTVGGACPCGVTCDASKGLSCQSGKCGATCGAGQQTCSGSCISLLDLRHCGSCDQQDVGYTLPYSLVVKFTDLYVAQCTVLCQGYANQQCIMVGTQYGCACSV